MKKKAMCFILSATMLLLSACGSAATPTTTTESKESKAPTESSSVTPVTIDLWHYFAQEDSKIFVDLIEKYNKTNTKGVTVVPTFVTRADLMQQYTMGAMSGELPDLGLVDNPDMASFIKMGVFEDITTQVDTWGQKDQFFEGPMKSNIQNDKIYGLPHNSNSLALYYNKKMLADAGVTPPTTWDELEAACKTLTTPNTYGLAISAIKNEEGTFQFIPWFLSSEGSLDNLAAPEAVKALTYTTGLIEKGYMSKDVINWTQSDVNVQFESGKAAMMVNGPWQISTLKADAPDLEYGVVLIPKDKVYSSVLGGENIGICKGANVEASFDFLTYLMEPQNCADFSEASGKFPPRKDSMELKEIWKTDPILSVFAESMNYAMPRGPHPRWPEISDAMSTAFHEAYTSTKTPQEALDIAATKIAAINAN